MKEIFEFRAKPEAAARLFRRDECKDLGGSAVKISLERTDPRFGKIGSEQMTLLRNDEVFYYSWDVRRKYNSDELKNASLFRLIITSVFEPCGEECGTIYDEASACPKCGAGAQQKGPLRLASLGLARDFTRTIAGEVVLSKNAESVLKKYATEVAVSKIVSCTTGRNMAGAQLIMNAPLVDVHPNTSAGADPFGIDPSGKCCRNDTIGVTVLSEVSIVATNIVEKSGLLFSRQFVGVREGLLRPQRMIFVTPELLMRFREEGLKGFEVERALIERL